MVPGQGQHTIAPHRNLLAQLHDNGGGTQLFSGREKKSNWKVTGLICSPLDICCTWENGGLRLYSMFLTELKRESGPPNLGRPHFIFPTSYFLVFLPVILQLAKGGVLVWGPYPKRPSNYLPLEFQTMSNPAVWLRIREWKPKMRVLSRLLKEQPSPTLASSRKTNYKFIQISGAEATYLPRGRYLRCWVFYLNMHF